MPRGVEQPMRSGTLPRGEFPDLLPGAEPKTKTRKTISNKSSNQPQVIDLSGPTFHVDDDALLSELLDDDTAYVLDQKNYPLSVSTAATEDSPPSPAQDYNRRYIEKRKDVPLYQDDVVDDDDDDEDEDEDEDEEGEEEDEDGDDVSSMESEDTHTLLDRAHDRLHLQELQDEIQHLKDIISRKNEEMEKMSGQLRRAVATKCDLVLAHNEMELHHEVNIKRRDDGLMQLKRANLSLLEAQSEVEKDLLNEIYLLTEKMKEIEEVHKRDVEEREEMHLSEKALKDMKIFRLHEELKRIKSGKKQQRNLAPVSLSNFLKK